MLSIKTILEFLFFRNKRAVLEIASNRWSLLVGAILVLSAGFAREYDGEFLVFEPWHLAIPFLASMFSCFCMTVMLSVVSLTKGIRRPQETENGETATSGKTKQPRNRVGFWNTYLTFLSLFWMTAPLAWIYAFPIERLIPPGTAMIANLFALFVVACWRVLLMIYAAKHVYGASLWTVFFPVMLFADVVAIAALILVPGPVFIMMGGVRLTASESIIVVFRNNMYLLTFGTILFWLFGTLAVMGDRVRNWTWKPKLVAKPSTSKGIKWLCAACLLVWLPILPFTQTEQYRRFRAENLLQKYQLDEFAEFAKKYRQKDFPPHWDPPPRPGFGQRRPDVKFVLEALKRNNNDNSQWLIKEYERKIEDLKGIPDALPNPELEERMEKESKAKLERGY